MTNDRRTEIEVGYYGDEQRSITREAWVSLTDSPPDPNCTVVDMPGVFTDGMTRPLTGLFTGGDRVVQPGDTVQVGGMDASPDRCQFTPAAQIETHLGPVHRVGDILACDHCKTAWVVVRK